MPATASDIVIRRGARTPFGATVNRLCIGGGQGIAAVFEANHA
jgi:hypothetical protein